MGCPERAGMLPVPRRTCTAGSSKESLPLKNLHRWVVLALENLNYGHVFSPVVLIFLYPVVLIFFHVR